MAELANALNAPGVGVHVAASGPGVVYAELSDVLAHLDITPGQPAQSAAIRAAEEWAEMEAQSEVAKALAQDANDVFLEKVGNTFVEEISLSDDEPEPDSMDDGESAGGRGVKAPPLYAELSSLFGPRTVRRVAWHAHGRALSPQGKDYIPRCTCRKTGPAVGHQIVH